MEENEKIVREFIAGWHDDLVATYERFLAPDCHHPSTAFPPCEDKDACLRLARAYVAMYPETTGHIKALAAQGDVVMVERVDECRSRDGRRDLMVSSVGVFRLRDGLIVYWGDYFDPRVVLEDFAP